MSTLFSHKSFLYWKGKEIGRQYLRPLEKIIS